MKINVLIFSVFLLSIPVSIIFELPVYAAPYSIDYVHVDTLKKNGCGERIIYSALAKMLINPSDSNLYNGDFHLPLLETKPVIKATVYSSSDTNPLIVESYQVLNLVDKPNNSVEGGHDSTFINITAEPSTGSSTRLPYLCNIIVIGNQSDSTSTHPVPNN